jgi:hypothetical protein
MPTPKTHHTKTRHFLSFHAYSNNTKNVPTKTCYSSHSKNTMAAEDEYYQLFDDRTERGKVLDDDWSHPRWENETPPTETLTDSEADQRSAYSITIQNLKNEYRGKTPPEVTSPEAVLRQRVVAPCLLSETTELAVAARSKTAEVRALRGYPPEIHKWVGFANGVAGYEASTEPVLVSKDYKIFWSSLSLAEIRQLRDEEDEQGRLLDNLHCLVNCGIVGKIIKGNVGLSGKCDFTLRKKNQNGKYQITVMCESKSTHNLLLPLDAEQCVQKYNEAFNQVFVQRGPRTPAWSMVCHPLGQLFGYMQDNKCPFTALTSGTRTYFISISGEDIKISDAWFVGEKNYLRAWAYMHSLGCDELEWKQPKSWKNSTKTNPTPKMGKGEQQNKKGPGTGGPGSSNRTSNNSSQGSSNEQSADIASLALPNISYNDIAIGDVIGHGRNGSCFKVVWNGQEFAMKQFDMGKGGEAPYRKEIAAYMRLRDAWGILVPTPMFLSESPSGWVKFLGLQLGRMPNEFDDFTGWDQILRSLKQEYGVRHNDAEGRNMIFIADSVTGGERMVAIDLEDWDDVPKARSFEKAMEQEEKKSMY